MKEIISIVLVAFFGTTTMYSVWAFFWIRGLNKTISIYKQKEKNQEWLLKYADERIDKLKMLLKPNQAKRGNCIDCHHWTSYSDNTRKCSFYGSQPIGTGPDDKCRIDNIKSWGFKPRK